MDGENQKRDRNGRSKGGGGGREGEKRGEMEEGRVGGKEGARE